MSIRIVTVDAFTNVPFSGNPAAVCILQEPRSEDWLRKVAREMDQKARDFLVKSGMQVNDVAPNEIARMREKVKPVIDKYSAQIGEPLVKEFFAELEKARKQK